MSDGNFDKLFVKDKVGVGVEQPEVQLHIVNPNEESKIYLESGGNVLQQAVDSGIASIGTRTSRPLDIRTENKSRIFISNGGNVGIGTTTPSFNLDVQGIINATQFNKNGQRWKITDDDIDDNTISGTKIKDKTITEAKLAFSIGGSQWKSGQASGSIFYDGGNVGIGKNNPAFNLDVNGTINATQFNKNGNPWKITNVDIDSNAAIDGNKIQDKSIPIGKLKDLPPSTSSQWVSGSSGNIYYSGGNVGIGTNNPVAGLEVQRTGSTDWLFLRQQRSTKGGGGFHIHNPWQNSDTDDRNRLEIAYQTAEGQTLWGQFVLHGPTGNVGIGTSSPQDKLDLAGNLRILTDSNPIRFTSAWSSFPDSKPNQAEISNDTKTFQSLMIVGNSSAGGSRRVSVWDDLGVNGNVRIGPSPDRNPPKALLHVSAPDNFGNIGGNIKLFPTDGQGTDFSYDGGPDNIFGFTHIGDDSGHTRFQKRDTTPLLIINNNGKVYIPGSLQVAGTKNFVMSHPQDDSKNIVYACIEGPEAAAYIRGKAKLNRGQTEVAFPEHFKLVVNLDTITIQLTPRSSESKGLAVSAQSEHGFSVKELWQGEGEYEFDYFASGVRKGFEDFAPVVPKESTGLGKPMGQEHSATTVI